MFLDIDSILFDKFNDLDVSWLHPDIKNSLFDSSDIFASKRILNLLETKIFCSYISNAPVALLSKNVKDCIDKLQFLHDYYVLESPTLQRPEFFKLQSEKKESYFDMPDINLFIHLPKLLFSRSIDYSFRQLFALFDIDYKILGKLLRANYLRRHKHSFVLSDKSLELKQVIIDFLSYQPELTLEENDVLIKFSDPIVYNVIFQPEFPFTGNIDILCTRLLANQFINHRLNSFLLYQFLCYKKQLIDDKKLLYFLIVSLQSTTQQFTSINQIEPASNTTDSALLEDFSTISNTSEITQPVNGSKIEIMQDHFPTMKSVLEDPNIKKHENSKVANSVQIPKYPTNIQAIIDRINKRINEVLPDKSISFPENPIFLIMKFLDSNTIELLHNDIENLLNTAREIPA